MGTSARIYTTQKTSFSYISRASLQWQLVRYSCDSYVAFVGSSACQVPIGPISSQPGVHCHAVRAMIRLARSSGGVRDGCRLRFVSQMLVAFADASPAQAFTLAVRFELEHKVELAAARAYLPR